MSKIAALVCDWKGCTRFAPADQASNWLSAGGGRGKPKQVDLCPAHAEQARKLYDRAEAKARRTGR